MQALNVASYNDVLCLNDAACIGTKKNVSIDHDIQILLQKY